MGILMDKDYRMLDYGPHIKSNSQFVSTNSKGVEIFHLPKEVTFIAEECFARHTPNIIIVPEECEALCGAQGVYDSESLKFMVFYCKNEDSPAFYNLCSTYTPQNVRVYLKDGSAGLPMAHFNRDIECFEVYCDGFVDAFNLFHFVDSPESHSCKVLRFVTGDTRVFLNANMGHDKLECVTLGEESIVLEELHELLTVGSMLPVCLEQSKGNYLHQAFLSKVAAGVRCAILTPKSYSTLKVGEFDSTRLNRLLGLLKESSFNNDGTITSKVKNKKELIEFQLSLESKEYNTSFVYEQIESELRTLRGVLKDSAGSSFLVSVLNNVLSAGQEGLISLEPFRTIASSYYPPEFDIPESVRELILEFESLSYDGSSSDGDDFEMTQEFGLF